jgi:hypothetical protein
MFLIEVISWATMLAIMPTLKFVVNYANSRLGKWPSLPSMRMVRGLVRA